MATLEAGITLLDGDFLEQSVLNVSKKKQGLDRSDAKKNALLYDPNKSQATFLIFLVLIISLIYSGWSLREENYITAESGLGYALGIIGALLMFLLLLYPLRKKVKLFQKAGSVKTWFMVHMIFGILGPVAALYHANFNTGSLNSTIVLYTTLIVAASGIAGRYVYTKIHYGLYGNLINFSDLKKDLESNRSSLLEELSFAPQLKEKFLAFDDLIFSPCPGMFKTFARLVFTGIQARWTQIVLLQHLKSSVRKTAERSGWSKEEERRSSRIVRNYISFYISKVIKISYFRFYEKVFSLWHVLHLPLFFLLIIFSLAHIFIVHMF